MSEFEEVVYVRVYEVYVSSALGRDSSQTTEHASATEAGAAVARLLEGGARGANVYRVDRPKERE